MRARISWETGNQTDIYRRGRDHISRRRPTLKIARARHCSVRPTYSDSPGLQDLPEAISSKRLIVSGDDTAYSSLRGRIRNQALARHSERG